MSDENIEIQLYRQSLLSELAVQALADDPAGPGLRKAIPLAMKALELEFGGFLEVLSDGETLLLSEGTGWRKGYLGREVGSIHSLLPIKPVTLHGSARESRASLPEFLKVHGITSGMSAVVEGGTRQVGVLGFYTSKERDYKSDEIAFLKNISKILGAVTGRLKQREDNEGESQNQRTARFETCTRDTANYFNNLLSDILKNANLALAEMSPYKSTRKRVQQIESLALTGKDITQQLLTFSGKTRYVFLAVNINDIIEDMKNLYWILPKNVRLQIHLKEDLPHIEADAQKIRKAVVNLVTNASDAIGESGGVITLRTGITSSEDCGDYIYMEVSDTGHGMDKSSKAKIFDPFFTTKPNGRGLGMAEVLGIVRGHRGDIFVDSQPGQGTTVRISLPSSAATPDDEPLFTAHPESDKHH